MPAELVDLASGALLAAGADEDDARLVARSLVDASVRGGDTHGIALLPEYLNRIANAGWTSPTTCEIAVDTGAVAVLDGGDGLGAVVATRAMSHARTRAREHGIGLVAVRNSGHFGAAGYFARQALQDGMVGVVMTNASPAMAPHGGAERLLSNNPWSIAVPANEDFDVVLDI